MGIFTPGWVKKALHLRTIVSCSPVVDIPLAELEFHDAMRDFRRGVITAEQMKERTENAAPPLVSKSLLFEPAEIYGWKIRASIYGREGKVWWLVGADRSTPATAKDKAMLVKILNVLGCDDPDRDQVSVNTIDELLEHGVPIMYQWPNMIELNEVQVHPDAAKFKDVQKGMRIVPRGTRPTDGFQRLPDGPPTADD
jgi:hypothetical protein